MAIAVEAKIVNLKNYIVNEMNNFNEILVDLGFDTASSKLKYF